MKITDASLRHSVTIFVLIGVLIVGGIATYSSLPREAAPEIEIPLVLVTTPYVGVSPEDIESLVTQPIEKELKDIDEIDELRSTSTEGASIVTVEFTTDTNLDAALQEVREKVDLAKPELPDDAEEPVIQEISTADFPMMIVNITGNYDLLALKRIAEDIEDDITNVPGVMDVTMAGDVTREIQVQVDPNRLNYFGVALQDVVNAIRSENVNVPGGDVDMGSASFLVRVPGEFEQVQPLRDLVVKTRRGKAIYLRDVAEVHDGFEERSTMSRLDRQNNISLTVTKRPGENIIAIADTVKQMLAGWEQRVPGGLDIVVLGDQSEDIRSLVSELENNMATGLLLVVAVIMVIMGLRNSLLVAAAIPLSMLIAFLVLGVLGITLNMIVLFSLILALGMLVDNAIVIVENIYRHATTEAKPPLQAAADGTREVAWPITTSTFTTVAAFFPLLFWPGVEGEFMGYLPRTIIITLLASLFVALVITPVLCAAFLRPKGNLGATEPSERASGSAGIKERFLGWYERALRSAVTHRFRTLLAAVAVLVVTLVLFGAANLGVEFFPQTTPRKISIDVDAGDGTTLQGSNRIVRQIESMLAPIDNVEHFVADVGSGTGEGFGSGSGQVPHQSRITVDFLQQGKRTEPVAQTVDKIRQGLDDIPGARMQIVKEQLGPPGGSPIQLEIAGEDFHQLGRLSERIQSNIEGIPGLVDLRDDYEVGRPEVRIHVDRERASLLNANTSQIGSTVRTAINGTAASEFRDGEEEYDITVRLAPQYRESLAHVKSLRINVASRTNPNVNYLVPIREVAEVVSGGGTGSIRHKDRDRVVTIEANTEGRLTADVLADIKATVAEMDLPDGYTISYAGEQERRGESQAFLSQAFLVTLFLIALILVTEFNSVFLPLIIMLSVVLSLVGVLWGQLLLQLPFGVIMTGLGVISLAGVVVNNGIVLVDYIQQLRERGRTRLEALVEGGMTRLRPVLLTAVTTVLGLVPMALGVSIDFSQLSLQVGGRSADFWMPMAIAVISGLLVATVLTLGVVPVLYSVFDDLEAWLRRLSTRNSARASATPPNPDTTS